MILLRRYWLHILILGMVVLVLGISHRWAWKHGGDAVRVEMLGKENKALAQAIADNAKANDERRRAQKKADELAKLPPKVIERVRQNPSGCSLNPAVADELRKQVDEINAAIRANRVR